MGNQFGHGVRDDVLQFQLDHEVATSLKVELSEDKTTAYFRLYSKAGVQIGEKQSVIVDAVGEKKLNTVELKEVTGSTHPQLVFGFANGNTIVCNLDDIFTYADTLVAAETSRAKSIEAANTTLIEAEESRALIAEGANAAAISTETERATAAEAEEAAARAIDINDLSEVIEERFDSAISSISQETTRAKAAEQTNAAAIVTEKSRAETAETTEQARAEAAEKTEYERALAAEQANSETIAAETTRATNVETNISNRVSDIETDYLKKADKEELAGDIVEEEQRAEAVEGTKLNVLPEHHAGEPYHFTYYYDVKPDADKVTATVYTITLDNNLTDKTYSLDIAAANSSLAGVMSAADYVYLHETLDGKISAEADRATEAEKTLTTNVNDALSKANYANMRIDAIEGKEAAWDAKQEAITDLDTIRSGAALGATAVQPDALNDAIAVETARAKEEESKKLDIATAESDYATIKYVNYQIDETKQSRFIVVDTLPTASADTMGSIYLCPEQTENDAVKYLQYITQRTESKSESGETEYNYEWHQIGDTAVKLDDYYKKSETYSSDEIDDKEATLNTSIDNVKVDLGELSQAVSTLSGDVSSLSENKQDKITDTAKLDYSLIDNVPNFATVDYVDTQDNTIIAKFDNYYTKTDTYSSSTIDRKLSGKQDTITDLDTIKSGAALGATALQPAALDLYRTSEKQDVIDTELKGFIDTNTAVISDETTRAETAEADLSARVDTIEGKEATWDAKQDAISDLSDIKSGAALGATALQSYTETDPTVPSHVKAITEQDITNWNGKSTFSGSYNDLTDKPDTLTKLITEFSKLSDDQLAALIEFASQLSTTTTEE